jgi:membrane associated rhomboid family serine protease
MSIFNSSPGYGRMRMFPPVIAWLIGINAAVLVIPMLLGNIPAGTVKLPATFPGGGGIFGVTMADRINLFGALWPIRSGLFRPWQYVTYMFMHGGFGHIFFNMLALWMFGIELAELWGAKRFLAFYLICGIGAGIIHSLVSLIAGDAAQTVGASGAIMGVMVGFGMAFPDRMVLAFFFFPLRARYAVLLFAAIDLFSGVSGSNDHVAHFAHLGGALVGYLLLKAGGALTLGGIFDRFPWMSDRRRAGMAPFEQPIRREPVPQMMDARYRDVPQQSSRREPPRIINFGADQSRIDEILDKINTTGYQGLTDEEKAILLEASKRMK